MGRELLMLAGQRTRVTWALTFNNPIAGALASARIDYHEQPPVTVRQPRPRRRAVYIVPALAALVLAGGAWVTGALEPVGMAGLSLGDLMGTPQVTAHAVMGDRTGAPAEARPLRMALRPDPPSAGEEQETRIGGAGVAPGGALPLSTVELTAPVARPLSESLPAGAAAPALNVEATAKSTAVAVSQALRGNRPRARTRANKDGRNTGSPEWLSSGSRPAALPAGMNYGTNNAPIFD
jgi:hypothetical protein